MNLLTEDWIPVEFDGERKRISLETLLTADSDWKLTSFRDDMELATIQLLVSLVQVCFMPKDKAELVHRLEKPLTSDEYRKGVEPFVEWFDLAHEKWPFMQTAGVLPQKGDKNFSTLHKLFVGLPEQTSSSPSSNAFFNRIDEIETAHFGDVAVALFQQSTNGFSLGGSSFSVGLKGGMPLTTLVLGSTLRHTIWCNVLTVEFSNKFIANTNATMSKLCENDKKKTNLNLITQSGRVEVPTWVKTPTDKESVLKIGLIRGLFWQPSRMKLKIEKNSITGFFTEPGLCTADGFWFHPHTPMDIVRLKNNNPKEKPYRSLSGNRAMWAQMLCYFYSPDYLKGEEGSSNASVVTQYREVFRGKSINLAVGGYVKGGSAESLAWRRHETYSLSQGWEDRSTQMNDLILVGESFKKALSSSIYVCSVIAFEIDENKPGSMKQINKIKDHIFGKYEESFYRNSEPIFHSILKRVSWDDEETYSLFISQLKKLTTSIYETTTESLNSDVKYLRGVAEGRRLLNAKIKEIIDAN